MVRTNQGGSVLGFVIIGGVLALLLVGGVYFVRQQVMAPPPDTGTVPQPSENNGGQTEQPSPAPQPEETTPEQQTEESQSLPGGGADELPRTGPAETFAAVLIFFALTAVTTAYVQSRRPSRSL